MSTLHLGTSSWTFDDWQGVFYPGDLPKERRLACYATRFNSVEVNTSFYGLPAPATMIRWLESVPEGFTFALKAPRRISHERRLVDCRRESLAYLDVLRSLGPTAAPGLLQLPPDFTRQREGLALARYLEWLAVRLDGLRLAVEVRAADLMTPAFAAFLARQGMALAVVDRAGTPNLWETWLAQREQVGAPDFAFVRLIGDDRESLPDNREVRRPQEEALEQWAIRIANLLRVGIHACIYVHNPYEGHAPATARRLRERVHRLYPLPEWSPPLPPEPAQPEEPPPGQMALF